VNMSGQKMLVQSYEQGTHFSAFVIWISLVIGGALVVHSSFLIAGSI